METTTPVESSPAAEPSPRNYQLFSSQAVMLASLLGSAAAGAVLMAKNASRLGNRSAATGILIGGILVDAVFFGIIRAMPQGAWLVLWVAVGLCMFYIARLFQGTAVEDHQINSGDLAPASKTFGIGIIGLLIIVGGALAIAAHNAPVIGKKLPIDKQNIYYSGDLTDADAIALNNALWKCHFFMPKNNRTVLYSKNHGETVLRFETNSFWLYDTGTMDVYCKITRTIAPSIGGLPITVKVVDEDFKVARSQIVK